MPRTILMGDPRYFSVLGGANPHTRNLLGMRKGVDAERARRQWHALARALVARGTEVCIIEPHQGFTGLVYPANAGFLHPLTLGRRPDPGDGVQKIFYLSNLLPSRAAERDVYRPFVRAMGYPTVDVQNRFEGEADLFPAGPFMLFTHGRLEQQRFVARFGIPPWKRIYGFRSQKEVAEELEPVAADRPLLSLELCQEAYYHGDTVLCSFGPRREYLLAYLDGLTPPSRELLRRQFGRNLIPLSREDAAIYAANSFQTDYEGRLYLFMPEGVSDQLLGEVRTRSMLPVLINVSEFLAKGGGSIKCMILDLGPTSEQPADPVAAKFRQSRSYQYLFGANL
jgi:N-dimethylarginine dimethylaminohydrolase